jgi:hypothetical protein
MSKVILIVPHAPPVMQKIVMDYVKNMPGWWHYGTEVWLIRSRNKLSTQQIRDDLSKLLPKMQFMVLEFPDFPSDWNGYGPPAWSQWFRDTWDNKE